MHRLRRLSRLRSEFVERSFAHTCETGAARRTWLRGRENVAKRYCVQLAARNLGVMMRKLFGVGTPRSLQGALGLLLTLLYGLWTRISGVRAFHAPGMPMTTRYTSQSPHRLNLVPKRYSSTGC